MTYVMYTYVAIALIFFFLLNYCIIDNIYYFTIIQLRWLLIGGIIFDDYINRCILYETKKEIVAFRLERFYTINYKSILGFKGLKMWRKMYHEGKQNIGI